MDPGARSAGTGPPVTSAAGRAVSCPGNGGGRTSDRGHSIRREELSVRGVRAAWNMPCYAVRAEDRSCIQVPCSMKGCAGAGMMLIIDGNAYPVPQRACGSAGAIQRSGPCEASKELPRQSLFHCSARRNAPCKDCTSFRGTQTAHAVTRMPEPPLAGALFSESIGCCVRETVGLGAQEADAGVWSAESGP